jgi:DnaJ-class molecular chaperone
MSYQPSLYAAMDPEEGLMNQFDPDTDCYRCAGAGIILTGSWGQRAENCPDCNGTGKQEQ